MEQGSESVTFEAAEGRVAATRREEALANLQLISQTMSRTHEEVELSGGAASYILLGTSMLLGFLGSALIKGWWQVAVWLLVSCGVVASLVVIRRQRVTAISRSARWLLGRQTIISVAILCHIWAVLALSFFYHAFSPQYSLVIVGLVFGCGLVAKATFVQPRRALIGLAYIVGSLLTLFFFMDYQLYALGLTFGLPTIGFGLYLLRRS